jgi:predicted ATPase
MRFTDISLRNWRNFLTVDVALQERMFVVGPNASGKSNLLDAFRFLRDLADPRGGFQQAVQLRHGVARLRSLHARRYPDVVVDVSVDLDGTPWRYHLAFGQDNVRRPVVKRERVWQRDKLLLDRPDDTKWDRMDPSRLGQTHLEQVNSNRDFREVAAFFTQVRYLHVVPQLIREPDRYAWTNGGTDPYGADFLEQLARMQKEQKRTFDSRLRRLNEALRIAVPQLKGLQLKRDVSGRPHLRGLCEHWRPDAGWQEEDQFSDGTLRLLGLLWSVLDGQGPLLLEEPELSLHEAVVRLLPAVMWKATRKSRRQLLVSTHSFGLLSDPGIDAREVLLLRPTNEGTQVTVAADSRQIRALLEGGLTIGEAVLPQVAPAVCACISRSEASRVGSSPTLRRSAGISESADQPFLGIPIRWPIRN